MALRDILTNETDRTLAAIRDNMRRLPKERHAQMFDEFRRAVDSDDVEVLADVVANWA